MQHVAVYTPKTLTPDASGSTRSLRKEPEAISRKWIDALFCRFGRIWPKAWADGIAVADFDGLAQEWSEGLAGLTGDEIKEGLRVCRGSRTWPPCVAEFRADCRPKNVHTSAAYRIYEPTRLLASSTREDTEVVAKSSFEKMREALR